MKPIIIGAKNVKRSSNMAKRVQTLFRKKPESIELYANKNIKPVNKFKLSDNHTEIEFSLNSSSSKKKNASKEVIHYEVQRLVIKKAHPKIINSFDAFGKNKIFNEYGFQLRINMCSNFAYSYL